MTMKDKIDITFHDFTVKTEAFVSVLVLASNEYINGIRLAHEKGEKENIQVFMPQKIKDHWSNDYIDWDRLVEIIKNEYKIQVLEEHSITSKVVRVEFNNVREVTTCIADLRLTYKLFNGFRIEKIKGEKKIIISKPIWMKSWNYEKISWGELCSIIAAEYDKEKREITMHNSSFLQDTTSSPERDFLQEDSDPDEPKQTRKAREKNELGRIKNADNSSFIFYPRTVLRAAEVSGTNGGTFSKKPIDLVKALNKGSLGGIGSFEINLLEWIEKLRYTTNTTLLDLIRAGYVSFGWRNNITQKKLSTIISRMSIYGLVTLTRFMTVNDDGTLENEKHSVMRVITMGQNGSTLLHELGKNTSRFNPFDTFQDGNTVKRYLTANQWLVYWLTTYREEIGENYETSCILTQKGTNYTGARTYATVTLNNCTMIAEPIRRVEDFEIEHNKQWLCEKIERMILMFNNMDQLYYGKYKINFPQRPIIVLICEDDMHINEVWEIIRPILENYNQAIWFTSDLKIFNYNKRGERFLYFDDNNQLQKVNIKAIFGKDNEAEQEND